MRASMNVMSRQAMDKLLHGIGVDKVISKTLPTITPNVNVNGKHVTTHGLLGSNQSCKRIVLPNKNDAIMFNDHVNVNKNIGNELFFVGKPDKTCFAANRGFDNLVRQIPEVLLRSHAENTNKTYKRVFNLWKVWANNSGVKVLPSDPFYVGLFLINLAQESQSAANIRQALPALVWAHRMAGLDSTLDNQFIKDIVNGLCRIHAKPRNPKEPVCSADVLKIAKNADF